jgi:hypothetical protein
MNLIKKNAGLNYLLEAATLANRQAIAIRDVAYAREAEEGARRRWATCPDELERCRLAGAYIAAQEFTAKEIERANDVLRVKVEFRVF